MTPTKFIIPPDETICFCHVFSDQELIDASIILPDISEFVIDKSDSKEESGMAML